MPLNDQAGMQENFKQHIRASYLFSVWWYILWGSINLICYVSHHDNYFNLFPRFPLYFLFSFNLWEDCQDSERFDFDFKPYNL